MSEKYQNKHNYIEIVDMQTGGNVDLEETESEMIDLPSDIHIEDYYTDLNIDNQAYENH